MTLCPSKSPESKTPCTLEDNEAAHYMGHEGVHPAGPPHKVSWRTWKEEHDRWEKSADN